MGSVSESLDGLALRNHEQAPMMDAMDGVVRKARAVPKIRKKVTPVPVGSCGSETTATSADPETPRAGASAYADDTLRAEWGPEGTHEENPKSEATVVMVGSLADALEPDEKSVEAPLGISSAIAHAVSITDVTEGDAQSFIALRSSLARFGITLLDVVIINEEFQWWSLHELTSGTTAWNFAPRGRRSGTR